MELEAVWLKDGEEIYCVSPVREIIATGGISNIVVSNGWRWCNYIDVCNTTDKYPNGFLVRSRANDGGI